MLLRFKADRRSLATIALYFFLVAAQWIVAPADPRVAAPLLLLTCAVSWITAVITHNTLHSPMFHDKRLNRAAQVVLSLTYGFPVSEYVPGHNLSHHRFTQSRRDVMRTTKSRYRWNLLNLLFFAAHVAPDVFVANMRYMKIMKAEHRRWYKQYLVEVSAVWGVKIALLLVDWRKCLLYVFIPHLFALWGITTVNFLQHDGCDMEHPYNHSRNFVGRFFNWFTFNNGFHGMHHVEPGLHWSLAPAEHAKRVAPFLDPRLDEPSLAAYLFKTFVFPGKRATFEGKPYVLPAEGPDEEWIPKPREVPAEVSLGAEPL